MQVILLYTKANCSSVGNILACLAFSLSVMLPSLESPRIDPKLVGGTHSRADSFSDNLSNPGATVFMFRGRGTEFGVSQGEVGFLNPDSGESRATRK